ncbi:hypothetical protein AB4304_13935 [Vibrio breoganii]
MNKTFLACVVSVLTLTGCVSKTNVEKGTESMTVVGIPVAEYETDYAQELKREHEYNISAKQLAKDLCWPEIKKQDFVVIESYYYVDAHLGNNWVICKVIADDNRFRLTVNGDTGRSSWKKMLLK